MSDEPTVLVAIGNSDDKLTQREWAHFRACVDSMVRAYARHVHGAWVSPSADPYQNAAWSFQPLAGERDTLREGLGALAAQFRQDSIAWTEGRTEFVPGVKPKAKPNPPPTVGGAASGSVVRNVVIFSDPQPHPSAAVVEALSAQRHRQGLRIR